MARKCLTGRRKSATWWKVRTEASSLLRIFKRTKLWPCMSRTFAESSIWSLRRMWLSLVICQQSDIGPRWTVLATQWMTQRSSATAPAKHVPRVVCSMPPFAQGELQSTPVSHISILASNHLLTSTRALIQSRSYMQHLLTCILEWDSQWTSHLGSRSTYGYPTTHQKSVSWLFYMPHRVNK